MVFAAGSTKNDYSRAMNSIPKDLLTKKETRTLLFPMTGNQIILSKAWQSNAREGLDVLESGRDTAFLTIGDP